MGRLTIQDIAKVLIAKNGLDQQQANRFATELFAIIQERLEKNDQVKVKGLGTFKVITVEARESVSVRTGSRVMIEEHSKITFTPDATMKELVNRPFSQFETVPLNDNVEFDDMKEPESSEEAECEDFTDDLTKDEVEVADEVIDSEPETEPEPGPEPEPEPEQEPELEQEPESEPEQVPESEVKGLLNTEPEAPIVFDDNEEESRSLSKWLWIAFGAICIACLSAMGGYYFGRQQTASLALSDTVFVRDTVYVAESQNPEISEIPAQLIAEQEAHKVEEPKIEQPKAEPQKGEPQKTEPQKVEAPKVETPKPQPAPEVDKYAAKDERVRLGAYRIVGLDHEVTVLAGQTFYSICRAHLGPDMECYIEVYNNLPRNPQIKAGQVIKIPKLQLKKRKKQ